MGENGQTDKNKLAPANSETGGTWELKQAKRGSLLTAAGLHSCMKHSQLMRNSAFDRDIQRKNNLCAMF